MRRSRANTAAASTAAPASPTGAAAAAGGDDEDVPPAKRPRKEEPSTPPASAMRVDVPETPPGRGQDDEADDDESPALSVVYVPGGQMPKLRFYLGKVVEVRIAARYLSTRNREVETRQVWGDGEYTDDSDAVAMLKHSGRMVVRGAPPPGLVGVSLFFRVLPGREGGYSSALNYGYRSRSWRAPYHNCSLAVLQCEAIDDERLLSAPGSAGAGAAGAAPAATRRSTRRAAAAAKKAAAAAAARKPPGTPAEKKKAAAEAAAAAAAAAGEEAAAAVVAMHVPETVGDPRPAKTRGKLVKNKFFTFNCVNEPALKYKLVLVNDSGVDKAQWTSARLRRDALYLEQGATRYELAREQPRADAEFDTYRWSRVRRVRYGAGAAEAPAAAAVPLPAAEVEVLAAGLDWEELEWGPQSVRVRGTEYGVSVINFRRRTA